ncbi:hypothetical protein O6H91_18G054200 [Diphasiastrum complanatum]|uniref:Uncharacterized protein n=1 Tax=Diphasiastrum complanatum TaxID=34168 RepID=A0ACC2B1H2_DIPCM|nr:hypothetical protein O6H91_18G054200 [Diphasiastrum complanatum]
MSLGYAEKLSFRADVGKVGMPELFDSDIDLQSKVEKLAELIRESRHMVVFTGAGISTSCGIPDFRGPKGIWTLQHEGRPMPKAETPFHQARPSLTHMALVELVRAKLLKFIISQNIDGLHLRSGVPRAQLAELHGNCFMEKCPSCRKEYLRDTEVETIGLKETGRRCVLANCGGKLIDTIVDWEDALPSTELYLAEKHSKEADLVLCLGTSLQITPACNLPLKALRSGGKLVIVNLQGTPKDKKATLLIHGRVDEVMAGVMKHLQRRIPPFVRIDRMIVSCSFSWTRRKSVRWLLRIASVQGQREPLHFLKCVEVMYPHRPDMKQGLLHEQPYVVRRETMKLKALDVLLKLHLGEGCMCSTVEIEHALNFEIIACKTPEINLETAMETLRVQAADDETCGRVAILETRDLPTSRGSAVEYAIVTSIFTHALAIKRERLDEHFSESKRGLENSIDFKEATCGNICRKNGAISQAYYRCNFIDQ